MAKKNEPMTREQSRKVVDSIAKRVAAPGFMKKALESHRQREALAESMSNGGEEIEKLQKKVKNLEKKISKLEENVDSLKEKVDGLLNIASGRGYWEE